jgi:uncharacterized protein (TIGR00251 family)
MGCDRSERSYECPSIGRRGGRQHARRRCTELIGVGTEGAEGAGGARDVAVRVVPRARRDEVGGERAGRLLVRTVAPPVDGKANEAVVRLVAAHFGVPVGAVTVVAGLRSRDKVVRVSDPGS